MPKHKTEALRKKMEGKTSNVCPKCGDYHKGKDHKEKGEEKEGKEEKKEE